MERLLAAMRRKGTKYDKVEILPEGATPISEYARDNETSSAYVHVKYDRFKFGYKKADGTIAYGQKPRYKIVDYKGTAYVI